MTTNESRKRRRSINISDYGETVGELSRLTRDLRNSLQPILFEIDSMQEFYFEALKRIQPFNKYVKNERKSIDQTIIKVLKQIKLLDNSVSVQLIREGKIVPTKPPFGDNPIDIFQKWILGYDKLPKDELAILKPKVEEDLHEINELVKKYEQHEEVAKFIQKRETQRNHQTKTILDFYRRSLQERQSILDYYLIGVYERAIEKSKAQMFNLGMDKWFNHLRDYPYELGKPWWGKNVDYERIDCLSHRIGEMAIDDVPSFHNLYAQNKEKFYRLLFKTKSRDKIFQSIEFNLSHLPLSKDRKPIFSELKRLFKGRKWIAFYALALPQVEGLFAEMVVAANPETKTNNSLSEKVKAVRPDYRMSDYYFDYYEYELPKQRNEFSHTGYTEGFKLKAYDLLTDLDHILSVFADLENPYVKISKIIKRRNQMSFANAKDFASYFALLNNVHPQQITKKKLEIEAFNNEFLKKACSLEFIIEEAARELEKVILDLHTKIEYYFDGYDIYRNFGDTLKPQIDKLKNDEIFCKKTRGFFDSFGYKDKVEEVFILRDFFQGLNKHLYKKRDFGPELETAFSVWDEKKLFVKNLTYLQQIALQANDHTKD